MKKKIYNFVAVIFSFYNYFFFRKLTIIGKEKIPNDGAIIFSPNHQSGLLDPLLVGLTCGKSLYSLTRSDIFRKPFLWILDAMQTIPVFRIRDGYEKLHQNSKTFKICYELLKNKKNLMIFSEAKHHDNYYLMPISKGSSRIGLEGLKKFPKTKIYLQAVGINYGNHTHPYHNCTIVYGTPINLNKFLNLYKKKPAETLNTVKLKLENEMKKCLWLPNKCKDYSTKSSFINYKSTKYEFGILKKRISRKDLTLINKREKTFIEKMAVVFFSIFNLIPLVLINLTLKKFDDKVFHLSVKYFAGLVFFSIWWTTIFFICVNILNLVMSVATVSILVLFLFMRQFLIIKYK